MQNKLLNYLLLLTAVLGFACGEVVTPSYRGEPLVTLTARMSVEPGSTIDGPVRVALLWYPKTIRLSQGETGLDDVPPVLADDIALEGEFPQDFRFPVTQLPPPEVLATLKGELTGKAVMGWLIAYRDLNGNGKADIIPVDGHPIDRVVGSSFFASANESFVIYYFDPVQQTPQSPMQAGYHLVRISDDARSVPVPLDKAMPITLSAGSPMLDWLLCEAAGSWRFSREDEKKCGISFAPPPPPPDEIDEIQVGGRVWLQDGKSDIQLWVDVGDKRVQNAQVAIAGQLIPGDELGTHEFKGQGPAPLYYGSTLPLEVKHGGRKATFMLTIPRDFSILAPTSGAEVKSGTEFRIAWRPAPGIRIMDMEVRKSPEGSTLGSDSTVNPTEGTMTVNYVGDAILLTKARMPSPPIHVEVATVHTRPLRFIP